MCHLVCGGGIHLSLLQKNCSTWCWHWSSGFPPEHVKVQHCFEICIVMYSSSISKLTSTRCLYCVCYGIECMPLVMFHVISSNVTVIPVCIVDMIEFTVVYVCIELWQFLVRQKYHSLESLYEFCSLACSVLSVSRKYLFPVLVALVICSYRKLGLLKQK